MNAREVIDSLKSFLSENKFNIEEEYHNKEYSVKSQIYASRKLKAGPFSAEDHLFIYDIRNKDYLDLSLKTIHDRSRSLVNSFFSW